jgi:tetratricopeptide (TPR) repeat protein
MKNYENHSDVKIKNEEKLINKSISLLMVPTVSKYIEESLLMKLKILNFNNITCIYKKLKKHGIALRSINYALELEEKLLVMNNNEEKYDIIPTYLNKAAIYSEMKKHREAIDIILKAKAHI